MELRSRRDELRPVAAVRRWVIAEVVGATAAIAVIIWAVELLGLISPLASTYGPAAVALAFLAIPSLLSARLQLQGDAHGLSGGSLWTAVAWGVALSLLVSIPFSVGFDVLQTRVLSRARGAGPGVSDYPAAFAGTPRTTVDRIALFTQGRQLVIYNGTDEVVSILPNCAGTGADASCNRRTLRPGGRSALQPIAAAQFSILRADGTLLPAARMKTGEFGQPMTEQPVSAPRDWHWLLWSLLTQLLVVAIPEEVFFRGYVQGRLRSCMPPRHTVLGVPFGAAHCLSSGLFALIHLVATPSAHRLLVFFPSLLFAWLAERNRNVLGATTHHALSNMMLQVARRLYA